MERMGNFLSVRSVVLMVLFICACNSNKAIAGLRDFDVRDDPSIKPGVDDLRLDPDFISGSPDWTFPDLIMRLHYTGEITGAGGANWEMKAEIPLIMEIDEITEFGLSVYGEASGQRVYIFEAADIGCIQKTTIEDLYAAAGSIKPDCSLVLNIDHQGSQDGISTMTCPGISLDVPFVDAAYFTEPDREKHVEFPQMVGDKFEIVIDANSTFMYRWQVYLPEKLVSWKERDIGMMLDCGTEGLAVGEPAWPPSIFDEGENP